MKTVGLILIVLAVLYVLRSFISAARKSKEQQRSIQKKHDLRFQQIQFEERTGIAEKRREEERQRVLREEEKKREQKQPIRKIKYSKSGSRTCLIFVPLLLSEMICTDGHKKH